ncbi:MAG: glycosyltransferase family 2 protein [Gammaproteobacteria bacterium]
MPKLSVFVTTFNNADTLDACLGGAGFADEIVVLDSFSTDDTLDIARNHDAQIHQHRFLGYGPQKQMALEHTRYDWVLLLDADEVISPELGEEIRELMRSDPPAAGYELARREQIFWKMSSPGVRWNYYLRLFDKRHGSVSDMPIHAAPKVSGRVERLEHCFWHFGERSVHIKVDKVNQYSSGLVQDKVAKNKRANPLTLIIYPPFVFVRSFIFKRAFLDGWAGFIASVVMAFYAFLRYAKLYEHEMIRRHGANLLPGGGPEAVLEEFSKRRGTPSQQK